MCARLQTHIILYTSSAQAKAIAYKERIFIYIYIYIIRIERGHKTNVCVASGDSASMPYFPQTTLYVAAIVTQPTRNTTSAQEKDKSLFCGKCTKNIVTERFLVCTTRSEFVYTFYFTTPLTISFIHIYPPFHIQPTLLPYSTRHSRHPKNNHPRSQ